MGAYAVVLAGGSGRRMMSGANKVFLPLRGIPVIVRAIAPFSGLTEGIVVVARGDELSDMELLLGRYGMLRKVLAVTPGGDTRQASVLCGLRALPEDADIALIHDGARAIVTEDVISRVLESVRLYGSGAACVPVTDTIKRAGDGGRVLETLEREGLYAMQTPQGFRTDALMRAHLAAQREGLTFTDDAALLEHAGQSVYLCDGSRENIKLTTPFDITLAEAILSSRSGGIGGGP